MTARDDLKFDRYLSPILLAIAALALLAAAALPVPVSLDGASHLYSAIIMRHLLAGDALYTAHFRLASPLIPNWLASLAAAFFVWAGFLRRTVVLMNLLVVALTEFALWFVIRRSNTMPARPRQFYLLTILLPLAANGFLVLGFWGFLMSADFCFIAVALLGSPRFGLRRVAAPLLILLAYWCHPVPVIATGFIPLAAYVRAAWAARRKGGAALRHLTAAFLADVLPWGIAALLIVVFASSLAGRSAAAGVGLKSRIFFRLIDLVGVARTSGLAVLAPTATAGALFSVYIFLLCAGAVASRRAADAFRWQFLLFACGLVVAYLGVPNEFGTGFFIAERVLWLAIAGFAVAALSGVWGAHPVYLRTCAIAAALIVIVFGAENILISRRMAPSVGEVSGALAKAPAGSTMLLVGYRLTPQCSRWPLLERTVPERHWALDAAGPNPPVVLNDYEPGTGYFPVMYRDQSFSYSGFDLHDEFDFSDERTAAWTRALDAAAPGMYVLSWGVPSARSDCGRWMPAPLREPLERHYDLLYERENESRVQLWRRRPSTQ